MVGQALGLGEQSLIELDKRVGDPVDSEQDLNNVAVEICCELGRREMTLKEARALREQDAIELDKLAGESFEIRVNGRRFAFGEVVVVSEKVAVRITGLVPPQQQAGR